MHNVFDIYTIIFLALAVFIFLRLRSVLGQRTGRERPPYDPYSAREQVREPNRTSDKVVTLPPRPKTIEAVANKPAETDEEEAAPVRWKGIAAPDTPLEIALTSGGSRRHCRGGCEFRRAALPDRRARRLRNDRQCLC